MTNHLASTRLPVFDPALWDRLQPRWQSWWQRAGALSNWVKAEGCDDTFAYLAWLYSDPRRFYHTLVHVEACLNEFERGRVRPLFANPLAAELAIWTHDAIYEARKTDNESRSVDLADEIRIRRGLLDQTFYTRVATMIMATRHHWPTDDLDMQLVLDIDLSILGQPEEIFDEYDRAIRQEYSWVGKIEYSVKRKIVLQRFLDRDRIYGSEVFFKMYEESARMNLKRAIDKL